METEKYYFRVGAFCLAVLAAFVYYLIVFGGEEQRDMKRYAVYFDNSVAGLTRGAPIKLKGISVGIVDDIRFISRASDRILVVADIDEMAPIRTDTVATIAFQGITGTAYLSLENTSPPGAPPVFLTRIKGEKYPVIASRKSDLQEVLSNAPDAMGGVIKAAEQVQKLLSDRNIEAAQAVLAEAAGSLREIRLLARTLRDDPSVILRGSSYEGYKPQK